jgi:hypothetical protein
LIKKNNDILWVFSWPNPEIIPSYVVSGIMSADYLKIQKVIFLESHSPKNFLLEFKPKLIIINKAFHSKVTILAQEARNLNIKIISIFDDWHFSSSSYNNPIFTYNKIIANYSDAIVVKTTIAANLVKNNIGLIPHVIHDCLRFNSQEPIRDTKYPFEICWFGMHTNHDTLEKGLNEIMKFDFECNLRVITNRHDLAKERINKLELKKINLNLIKWHKSANKEIIKSDIVIIPYINDQKRSVKSHNRIIDSLNLGRLTIISKLPLTLDFEKYCFLGSMGNGLKWIKENKQLAINMLTDGSKFVKNNYNIETISNKWKKLIDQTLKQ